MNAYIVLRLFPFKGRQCVPGETVQMRAEDAKPFLAMKFIEVEESPSQG